MQNTPRSSDDYQTITEYFLTEYSCAILKNRVMLNRIYSAFTPASSHCKMRSQQDVKYMEKSAFLLHVQVAVRLSTSMGFIELSQLLGSALESLAY